MLLNNYWTSNTPFLSHFAIQFLEFPLFFGKKKILNHTILCIIWFPVWTASIFIIRFDFQNIDLDYKIWVCYRFLLLIKIVLVKLFVRSCVPQVRLEVHNWRFCFLEQGCFSSEVGWHLSFVVSCYLTACFNHHHIEPKTFSLFARKERHSMNYNCCKHVCLRMMKLWSSDLCFLHVRKRFFVSLPRL